MSITREDMDGVKVPFTDTTIGTDGHMTVSAGTDPRIVMQALEAVTRQREREAAEARDRLDAAKDAVNPDTHFVQPKISGYRQLTPADTLLINEAKALGNQMMDLHTRIVERAAEDYRNTTDHDRYVEAEPHRWAAIGKTHIQQGVMFLVRAVAQPTGV